MAYEIIKRFNPTSTCSGLLNLVEEIVTRRPIYSTETRDFDKIKSSSLRGSKFRRGAELWRENAGELDKRCVPVIVLRPAHAPIRQLVEDIQAGCYDFRDRGAKVATRAPNATPVVPW